MDLRPADRSREDRSPAELVCASASSARTADSEWDQVLTSPKHPCCSPLRATVSIRSGDAVNAIEMKGFPGVGAGNHGNHFRVYLEILPDILDITLFDDTFRRIPMPPRAGYRTSPAILQGHARHPRRRKTLPVPLTIRHPPIRSMRLRRPKRRPGKRPPRNRYRHRSRNRCPNRNPSRSLMWWRRILPFWKQKSPRRTIRRMNSAWRCVRSKPVLTGEGHSRMITSIRDRTSAAWQALPVCTGLSIC